MTSPALFSGTSGWSNRAPSYCWTPRAAGRGRSGTAAATTWPTRSRPSRADDRGAARTGARGGNGRRGQPLRLRAAARLPLSGGARRRARKPPCRRRTGAAPHGSSDARVRGRLRRLRPGHRPGRRRRPVRGVRRGHGPHGRRRGGRCRAGPGVADHPAAPGRAVGAPGRRRSHDHGGGLRRLLRLVGDPGPRRRRGGGPRGRRGGPNPGLAGRRGHCARAGRAAGHPGRAERIGGGRAASSRRPTAVHSAKISAGSDPAWHSRAVTHSHVAGSIHADVAARAPGWLSVPDDVNALLPSLWSDKATKDADGVLTVAGISVTEIADQVGTPAYVLDEADLRARARAFATAFAGWDVYYAAKSFLCTAVARWVSEEGLGIDVCTGGELAVTQRAGVDLRRVGLHGNNKSVAELRQGLTAGVGRIIVDSFAEIARLGDLAAELDVRPRVMVRVTTGVEAHTHEYIATAHEDQKFGFSIAGGAAAEALRACHDQPDLDLAGIHSHIGSQIFDADGFEVAARRTLRLHAEFAKRTRTALPELNLGGGFGIAYTSVDSPSSPKELAA